MWRYHSNYTVWGQTVHVFGVRAINVALISIDHASQHQKYRKDVKRRYIDYHNLKNEGKILRGPSRPVSLLFKYQLYFLYRWTNEEQNYSFSRILGSWITPLSETYGQSRILLLTVGQLNKLFSFIKIN